MNTIQQINTHIGNIDLYLLDHILKERFNKSSTILDAGCGEGRNLSFFVNEGYEVYAVDREPMAIKMCRMRFSEIPGDNFICQSLTQIPFPDNNFDLVISSAVLHFAESEDEFQQMWKEHTRVTKPGGLLFLRMAALWGGVKKSEFSYYLTDEVLKFMLDAGWKLAEPVKTVLVNKQRSMSALLFERVK